MSEDQERLTLLETIKKEHDLLSGRLALLQREISTWSGHAEPDYDLLHALIEYFSVFPDEIHHKKEDHIYAALIGNNVLETDYLKRLKSEHEEMGTLKETFAKNLENLAAHHVSPKWSLIVDVGKYIEVQEIHMADEESQFLPLAHKELSQKQLLEVTEIIQHDLITDSAKQTFDTLNRIDTTIDEILRKKS